MYKYSGQAAAVEPIAARWATDVAKGALIPCADQLGSILLPGRGSRSGWQNESLWAIVGSSLIPPWLLIKRILYFINGRSGHWRVLLEIAESAFSGRRFGTPGLLIRIGSTQHLRGIVVLSHIDALPYLRDTTRPTAAPSRGRHR